MLGSVNKCTMLGAFVSAFLVSLLSVVQIETSDLEYETGLVNDDYRKKGAINTIYYGLIWIFGFGNYISVSVTAPYKKPIYKNLVLFIAYISILIFSAVLYLLPEFINHEMFQIVLIPFGFRLQTYLMVVVIILINTLYQKYFVDTYLV